MTRESKYRGEMIQVRPVQRGTSLSGPSILKVTITDFKLCNFISIVRKPPYLGILCGPNVSIIEMFYSIQFTPYMEVSLESIQCWNVVHIICILVEIGTPKSMTP